MTNDNTWLSERIRQLETENQKLKATLPLVQKVLKTVDQWNKDPDVMFEHPLTKLADQARPALK
jgi:hypothetical protein